MKSKIVKYHRTLTTYINALIQAGFSLVELIEPEPEPRLLESNIAMQHELRRPMFLMIAARKKNEVIAYGNN